MSERFDRQGMQAPGYKILQRIIHKAMARYAGASFEEGRGYAHPEMGAGPGAVGPRVAGVRRTFIEHFERGGGKKFREALAQRFGGDAGAGSHDFEVSSCGR